MKTTLRQCENLTFDILQKRLQINEFEVEKIINLLIEEHVIRKKYTFECPFCNELNTVSDGELETDECQYCFSKIDTEKLIEGATIRYVLDKNDFYEFMQENYREEYEAAQRGEVLVSKVVPFTAKNTIKEVNVDTEEKIPRLFISHSTKDMKYVKAFVELLEQIGMPDGSIFCSSVDGYKIEWGNDIYEYLADEFTDKNKELLVIFMLSENYYKSVACLNEMGATWVLKKDYRSILLPGFEFSNIEGAINPRKISVKLDANSLSTDLNGIKNQMAKIFKFTAPIDDKWDRIRNNFEQAIQQESLERNMKRLE